MLLYRIFLMTTKKGHSVRRALTCSSACCEHSPSPASSFIGDTLENHASDDYLDFHFDGYFAFIGGNPYGKPVVGTLFKHAAEVLQFRFDAIGVIDCTIDIDGLPSIQNQ